MFHVQPTYTIRIKSRYERAATKTRYARALVVLASAAVGLAALVHGGLVFWTISFALSAAVPFIRFRVAGQ